MELLINQVFPYILSHAYFFLFIGMLVGGEVFLLPAIYFATNGTLDFSLVFLFSILATLISDTIWYIIGRSLPLKKIMLWKMFDTKKDSFTKIGEIFDKHSQKLLYISKFVYGTRILAQVLSGAVRMRFLKYFIINISGIITYLFMLTFFAILTKESLASFERVLYYEYASVGIFILVMIIIHIYLKKWLNKNFTASSSQL